jgi:F-type H+-transporting ATPase subunit alpha
MTELTISASEITEALRKHVTEFNPTVTAEQVGRVVEVGDGIARVSGLPSAKVNELLEFEDGTAGPRDEPRRGDHRCRRPRRGRQHRRGADVRATGRIQSRCPSATRCSGAW